MHLKGCVVRLADLTFAPWGGVRRISALGEKLTPKGLIELVGFVPGPDSCTQQMAWLFDHLVRACNQCWWYGETERLRGL